MKKEIINSISAPGLKDGQLVGAEAWSGHF